MSSKTFTVTILTQFCKGCGLCVEFCDPGKLHMNSKPDKRGLVTAEVRAEADCTGCLRCATICPDAAVRITCVEAPLGKARGRPVASRSGEAEEPSGK
ncbi:MAG: 4Fe-4S dicluster domain-containing protein [Planctomycetota bacterium]|jgi:2-oxoglutarate ferredoxin oxidoreductase subunit delta